jgi:hypothetical protein
LRGVLELRPRVPLRRAEDEGRTRPDDEVRHVLRPYERREEPCVRPSARAARFTTAGAKTWKHCGAKSR